MNAADSLTTIRKDRLSFVMQHLAEHKREFLPVHLVLQCFIIMNPYEILACLTRVVVLIPAELAWGDWLRLRRLGQNQSMLPEASFLVGPDSDLKPVPV